MERLHFRVYGLKGENMQKMNERIITKYIFIFLVCHCFFSFLWTNTVVRVEYANNIISFLIFSYLLLLLMVRGKKIYLFKPIILWLPFLLYTIVGYAVQGEIVYSFMWGICIIILLLCISGGDDICVEVTLKTIYLSGFICVLGVWFQLFFDEFYYDHIVTFFLNSSSIIAWGKSHYGFAGFTYQLDTTAVPIMYLIGGILYTDEMINKKGLSQWKKAILFLVLFISVILTGKRTNSLLTILIPGVIFIVSKKDIGKRFIAFITTGLIGLFGFYVVLSNVDFLYRSNVFHRIGSTIVGLRKGLDISSGRYDLYDKALQLFSNDKLFGIGVGNFINKSGMGTDVHNVYLQVLCEQGIVGEILFLIPLVYFLLYTIKRIRKTSFDSNKRIYKMSLYIQLIYIGYSITGNLNINLYGYMIYFLAIGIVGNTVLCEKKLELE